MSDFELNENKLFHNLTWMSLSNVSVPSRLGYYHAYKLSRQALAHLFIINPAK